VHAALKVRREDGVGRVGERAELERRGAGGARAGGDRERRGELPALERGVVVRRGDDRGRGQHLRRGRLRCGEGGEGQGQGAEGGDQLGEHRGIGGWEGVGVLVLVAGFWERQGTERKRRSGASGAVVVLVVLVVAGVVINEKMAWPGTIVVPER
jgi:hypothetical protein